MVILEKEVADMGREVRMVPPNWEHPKEEGHNGEMHYVPMYDENYEDARREWLEKLAAHKPEEHDGLDYWEWDGGPPDRQYYRTWKDEEATWFQVWETVSEGTPVSPPFATKDELIEYLAKNGDWWDQKRCQGPPLPWVTGNSSDPGWGLEAATRFVNSGWAPSGVITNGKYVEGKFAI